MVAVGIGCSSDSDMLASPFINTIYACCVACPADKADACPTLSAEEEGYRVAWRYGGSALSRYKTVNWGEKLLYDGSRLNNRYAFIYCCAAILAMEVYLADRIALSASVRDYFLWGVYTIRYFQFDGEGTLSLNNNLVLLPNDRYLLEYKQFRLYYTSECEESQNFVLVMEDNFGQSCELEFDFQHDNKSSETDVADNGSNLTFFSRPIDA